MPCSSCRRCLLPLATHPCPPCSCEQQPAGGAGGAGAAAHLPAPAAVQGGHRRDAAAQVRRAHSAALSRLLLCPHELRRSRCPGLSKHALLPTLLCSPPHLAALQPQAAHRPEPQRGLGAGGAHRWRAAGAAALLRALRPHRGRLAHCVCAAEAHVGCAAGLGGGGGEEWRRGWMIGELQPW